MFLLDTNVISELRKHKPHGAVMAWYSSQHQSAYFVPSLALYELQVGVEITRRQDAAKAMEIQCWIDALEHTATVLPLDAMAARETARLMVGRSDDLTEDAMIAAIALTNRLTVATRNLKDFKTFQVPTVNPFQYETS